MEQEAGQDGLPARRKILIVDDEPKICYALSEHFVFNGYEVRRVARGEEALALLPAYYPDVIILDILMPGMGGVETLKHLRHLRPKPKIVVLSVADHEEVVRGALQLGADFYLTKPVNFKTLTEVVNGFLPAKK